MSLTIEQLEIQQIKDEIDDIIYIWIEKNINVIVWDFELCRMKYMKTLLKQNPTNFRENIENDYLNERILRVLNNHKTDEERAKKYKPYSKKPKA